MRKTRDFLKLSILSSVIFLLHVCSAYAEAVPAYGHTIEIVFKNGKILQATERYFDREYRQYRHDDYSSAFKDAPVVVENAGEFDFKYWEKLKLTYLPDSVTIFGAEDKYVVMSQESDYDSSEVEDRAILGNGEKASNRERIVSVIVFPKDDPTATLDWIRDFSPNGIANRKLREDNFHDEVTGEYCSTDGLYQESYTCYSADNREDPDCHLNKMWYAPNSLLNTRKIMFSGKQKSLSLYTITLTDYTLSPKGELFDPESTPFTRTGYRTRVSHIGGILHGVDDSLSPSERSLAFPDDRNMGLLYVGAPAPVRDIKWEYLADARGQVTVPAGKAVKLRIRPDHANDLSPLAALESGIIIDIDLSNTPIPDDELVYLTRLTSLASLNLRNTQISDRGLAYLWKIPSLEVLEIGNGLPITDKGLAGIGNLASLKTLDLSLNNITDVSLNHLEGLKSLEELRLTRTGITDKGLSHLLKLNSLKNLDISYMDITDDGLSRLKELKSLEELRVAGTDITDTGLKEIAELPNLRLLHIFYTEITDEGLKHLVSLPSLEDLALIETRITDQGVISLREMTSLKFLVLEDTEISDAAAEELQRALPNCRIYR
jgi:hypothetical protein